jgi:uncharacterized protein involved in propanediol utilization
MTASVPGHFGEWLQGRLGPEGEVVLVTVVCSALAAHAGRGRGTEAFPAAVLKAFTRSLGLTGALPDLSCDMPLGGGCGASTATLVACARGMGWDGAPEELARACVAVEGASDPLMFTFPDRLLWASRRGTVLRALPPPPLAEILGGFLGEPMLTDPSDVDFADVSDLLDDWERAAGAGDLARAAAVATDSARRNRDRRGGSDVLEDLARELGALGTVAAHTGSSRGLIFAPGDIPAGAEEALRAAGLRHPLRFVTGGPT